MCIYLCACIDLALSFYSSSNSKLCLFLWLLLNLYQNTAARIKRVPVEIRQRGEGGVWTRSPIAHTFPSDESSAFSLGIVLVTKRKHFLCRLIHFMFATRIIL